jgi:transposase, IS5 family
VPTKTIIFNHSLLVHTVTTGRLQYEETEDAIFEPHTEIIRKGKASKPNEFGKLVQVQEAENQIITHYEVFAERPPSA